MTLPTSDVTSLHLLAHFNPAGKILRAALRFKFLPGAKENVQVHRGLHEEKRGHHEKTHERDGRVSES